MDAGEGIVEPFFNERDGQMGNINPNPLPSKLLRRVNGGSTAAEGVQDYITFIAARLDDPFKERKRFLCGITKTFLCLGINRRDICPDILQWHARLVHRDSA